MNSIVQVLRYLEYLKRAMESLKSGLCCLPGECQVRGKSFEFKMLKIIIYDFFL